MPIDGNQAKGEESRDDEGATVTNPDQPYIEWILAALARPSADGRRKKTQLGLSRALGIDHAQVSRMLRGKRRLKHWEIAKVAEYLEEPAPDIRGAPAFHKKKETGSLAYVTVTVSNVPVRGECAGGRWLEYELGDNDFETVPVVPTKYPQLEQFAFRVRGNSMDRAKIIDGDYVVCVPYFEARANLTHGDIVVVERRRGGLYERTCKRLEVRPDGSTALVSQSNDPKSADPLLELQANSHADDGVEIEVVGLVIGRYSPL